MRNSPRIVSAMLFLLCAAPAIAMAANAIQQIQVRRDGNNILLKLEMQEPIKAAPGTWSIVEPPRVVFDFPDTDNKTGTSVQQVNEGDLKTVNLVQADSLTRVVLNLYRATKYSTEVEGKNLYIRLTAQAAASNAESAPSAYQRTAASMAPAGKSTDRSSVREISFRRGDTGQGLVLIDLTDGSVPVDIRRVGNGLLVELQGVDLPARLQNKRDVNDFATLVNSITAKNAGGMVQLDIAAHGRWFHQAKVVNNQLVIEVNPIPLEDANKLVQTGQQGQKVSINFYQAEATMVLRTLAEISGKNLIVDPSLAGRQVTIALDNISYDQALDIVMGQVNAGYRIRNDIILFGDRAVLQKRDQDSADELARSNDTAPLVSETFTLSYIKPSELATLIRANISQPGGAGAATTTPATAAPASGAPAGGGGMMSARGTMATHDLSKKLFIRDTETVVEAIREVVRNVDVPQKQVMIEARIVEASTGFSDALGVRLKAFDAGVHRVAGTDGGVKFATSAGGNLDLGPIGGTTAPTLTRTSAQAFGSNFNLAGSTAINLMLFNSAATKLLTLELQAAEADSRNKTVSSPRVVTMDRKAATINNTQQVTILTGVNATTGLPIYQTFSAPLNLTVTPSINPDNRVSLELSIAKSTITNASTGSLDTNTLTTSVIVENGGTVVIGGFTRESNIQSQERVPFLGDLPYVGFLFKSTTRNEARSELMVFITPRIVSNTLVQN
ncbi:MAG: type IV pilus secretin PilQ [Rhodocyclaceae bacterium]|nr:type IV pilus secretin PilQ [Rhodocyclaceae bacterium]MBK9624265.1 type IV pilus secretin PilQ [Rhodocyclaceae bacterium]MBP6108723.1 type IV pilus secretin PilQ [Rhodocyclaceae bacterium]MBP6278862.1 type IV pilus secretin PilQ [Rhodocyclaceae bacterium]